MKLLATTFAIALFGYSGCAFADNDGEPTSFQFVNNSIEPLTLSFDPNGFECFDASVFPQPVVVQPGIPSPVYKVRQNKWCNDVAKFTIGIKFQSRDPLSCRFAQTHQSQGESVEYEIDPTGGCPQSTNPSIIISSTFDWKTSSVTNSIYIGSFTDPMMRKSLENASSSNQHFLPLKEIEHYNTSKVNPMMKGRKMMSPKPLMENR